MKKTIKVGAYEVIFERRRYGGRYGTTYTWVSWLYKDEWLSTGDPWPCLNPPRKEITQTIDNLIQTGWADKLYESTRKSYQTG